LSAEAAQLPRCGAAQPQHPGQPLPPDALVSSVVEDNANGVFPSYSAALNRARELADDPDVPPLIDPDLLR